MTEITGSQSSDVSQPVEDSTPPWERKWNDHATELVVDNTATPEPIAAPWDMMWGSPEPAPDKPITARSNGFDTVFNQLVKQESSGNHTDKSGSLTRSPVGAMGITQVMPKTGDDPGFGVKPIQNSTEGEYLRFGKDYLRAMLKEFNGDYEKALGAYNAGIGTVQKAISKADKAGGNWQDYLSARVKRETLPYIRNILGK